MFNFFRNRNAGNEKYSDLPVSTDMHSHILPGIDDGSPDVESSLKLIQGLVDLGIHKFIATPHIIGDLYRNTPETIQIALDETKEACRKAGMNIELSAAAEYMIDDYFVDLLKKKSQLLTLHKNILLTEISYSTPPVNLEQITEYIIAEGYKPVLAHPERYHFYHYDYDIYYRLKEMGFLLQVNLLSLTGYYGKAVKKAARFIIEKNLAPLVGTDLHHRYHLSVLRNPETLTTLHKYLGNRTYNDLELLAKQEQPDYTNDLTHTS